MTSEQHLYTNVIMAGFGGQGLMFIGKLLAYCAMKRGLNVTLIPSYGPEMRGGKANCTVVISDEPIGSPVINSPEALIVMNNPSLEAFESQLKSDGLLFIDSTLVNRPITRKDVRVIAIPADDAASELGEKRTANLIMLGAYIAKTHIITKDDVANGLKELFSAKIASLNVNMQALEKGMKYAEKLS